MAGPVPIVLVENADIVEIENPLGDQIVYESPTGEPDRQVTPTERIKELPLRSCSYDQENRIITIDPTRELEKETIDLSVFSTTEGSVPRRELILGQENLRPYMFRLEFEDDQGNTLNYFYLDFSCQHIDSENQIQFTHPVPFMRATRTIIDGKDWLTNFVDINLSPDDIMFNNHPDMEQRYFLRWETELTGEEKGPQSEIGYFIVHFITQNSELVRTILLPDSENPENISIRAADTQPDLILEEMFQKYDNTHTEHASVPWLRDELSITSTA